MNLQKVRNIISLYKHYFKKIHKDEIYKWRAVKQFQDNWNLNAKNFNKMLDSSMLLTKNLLDSSFYYPKKMLLQSAAVAPALVRDSFENLYDEENDLKSRVLIFQKTLRQICRKEFPDLKNDYQDLRAIMVYLCLRYPDRYYLYKYGMFKQFAQLVDYPYLPSRGDLENILQYLAICSLVKEEILMDNELLELHRSRISHSDFFDISFNILTQDVIYASVQHIKSTQDKMQDFAIARLVHVSKPIFPIVNEVIFKGTFTNYIDNQKENKRIGDLGELLVVQHEQEKLKLLGIRKEVVHKSKTEGDGLGYDILSYNNNGEEMFIEVKTTKGSWDSPFFITANEYKLSVLESGKFYLYRLYDFEDTTGSAKYYTVPGDLTNLCNNPVLYKVNLREEKSEY